MLKNLLLVFFCLFANLALAQSPGGVNGGLIDWHKVSALGVVADGNTVASVADSFSPANYAAAAPAAGNRPAYYSVATPINFNPYLRFDGTNDFLRINDNANYNTTNSTRKAIFTSFRTRTGTSALSYKVIYKERNQNDGLNIYIYGGNIYCAVFNTGWTGLAAANRIRWASNPISDDTNYIVSLQMDGAGGTTPTGNLYCYLNGALFSNTANSNQVGQIDNNNQNINIGAKENRTWFHNLSDGVNTTNHYNNFDFTEFAYYNATLISAVNRNRAESYLAVKSGITLDQSVATNYNSSGGVVIYNATGTHNSYRNDIAGIGIDNGSALNQPRSKSVNSDAIVTMSTPSAMATGEFLIWGNDNDDDGTVEEIYTGIPGTVAARLDRVWRVDQTGDVGTVTVAFDLNGISVAGTTASDFKLLVDSVDSDFTSGATVVNASSYSAGIVTFNLVDFTGDDYFTLATAVAPPVVSLATNLTVIAENGGTAIITASIPGVWGQTITVNLGFSGTAIIPTDYSPTAYSITIPIGSTSGTIQINPVDDSFSEGNETVIIDITSVVNATENGSQQVTVNITDDDPANNACDGQEGIYTTELGSGDINNYNLTGSYIGTSTSAYTGNYEMVIDPDNLYRYLASYTGQKITRSDLNGGGEVVLFDTAPNLPFQIAVNPIQGKIYWTEWSATARIMCANLDGTGVPVAIASGLNYPTGLQIDKNTGRLFLYSGFDAPVHIARADTDGSCGAITLVDILNTGLDLAYNLTIDPPGARLFFVDYNGQFIRKVNTDGTGVQTIWNLTGPGDLMRDIVYNKNTNKLFWVHTNGVVQTGNADGSGVITTVVASGQPDSRSIDICVDDAPPRLTRFYSLYADGRYCSNANDNGNTIVIRAVYDEAVIAGSTLTVVLNNGASVVLNNISGNEISGTYTVGAAGSGQNTNDLNVASISSESVSDSNNNVRINSTVPNTPNNIADTSNLQVETSPNMSEVTPVTTPTIDRTPDYTFYSDVPGTITVGGGCGSTTTTMIAGNNTITLDSNGAGGNLPDGTYSSCTITATSSTGCLNTTVFNISPFVIAATVPTVTLSRTPATIAEAGGVSTVTATLSNTYALPVTVNLGFSGTASGSDYNASASSIVIPALSTTGSVTVTGLDDLIAEGNETVDVDITSVTNGTESGVQQVTITIIDDESAPTATLSINKASLDESGSDGFATITATLSGISANTITINLAFSGTAVGADYNLSASAITINPGNLTGSITLTPVDDTLFEENETVIIDIDTIAPPGSATEGSPNQVTTTIVEDVLCNQSPSVAPSGYTAYITASIEKSIPSLDPLPGGEAFDTYVDSLPQYVRSTNALRSNAEQFFLSEYGIDFTDNADTLSADGNFELLFLSYSTETGASNDLDPRIHNASGYNLTNAGGKLHAGIYYAVFNNIAETETPLTGVWGGAGIMVPIGTLVDYGEYLLEFQVACSDNDTENYTSDSVGTNSVDATEKKLIAFKSKQPALADYNNPSTYGAFNFWLDAPQVFEYDIIDPGTGDTYSYIGGEVRGITDRRDTEVMTTITITQ